MYGPGRLGSLLGNTLTHRHELEGDANICQHVPQDVTRMRHVGSVSQELFEESSIVEARRAIPPYDLHKELHDVWANV